MCAHAYACVRMSVCEQTDPPKLYAFCVIRLSVHDIVKCNQMMNQMVDFVTKDFTNVEIFSKIVTLFW